MNAIRSTVALATLAVGLAACSVNDGYYAPRSQATYYPARTTYYSAPPTMIGGCGFWKGFGHCFILLKLTNSP